MSSSIPILILCEDPCHSALECIPNLFPDSSPSFLVTHSLQHALSTQSISSVLPSITSLIYIPPTNPTLLIDLHLPNLLWIHCFSAGVDKLHPFLSTLSPDSTLILTNGRGAFSSSLSEYIFSGIFTITNTSNPA